MSLPPAIGVTYRPDFAYTSYNELIREWTFMRLQRRNFAWLTVLGALIGIAVLSGAPGLVSTALLGIFALAAAATVIDFQPDKLLNRSRASLTTMRMSTEAREAVERAHRRGSYYDDGLTLLDVCLLY